VGMMIGILVTAFEVSQHLLPTCERWTLSSQPRVNGVLYRARLQGTQTIAQLQQRAPLLAQLSEPTWCDAQSV